MNKFDKMKAEILAIHPHISSLPWTKRIKAFFLPKGAHIMTEQDGTTIRRQHATLVTVDGKDYVYCWGSRSQPMTVSEL